MLSAGTLTNTDRILVQLARIAVPVVLQIAGSFMPESGYQMPQYIAEAIAMRAMLAATGAFSDFVRYNPLAAFRDYNIAAGNGFSDAWFHLGKYYEEFGNNSLAKKCFEHGVELNVESCIYVSQLIFLFSQQTRTNLSVWASHTC